MYSGVKSSDSVRSEWEEVGVCGNALPLKYGRISTTDKCSNMSRTSLLRCPALGSLYAIAPKPQSQGRRCHAVPTDPRGQIRRCLPFFDVLTWNQRPSLARSGGQTRFRTPNPEVYPFLFCCDPLLRRGAHRSRSVSKSTRVLSHCTLHEHSLYYMLDVAGE